MPTRFFPYEPILGGLSRGRGLSSPSAWPLHVRGQLSRSSDLKAAGQQTAQIKPFSSRFDDICFRRTVLYHMNVAARVIPRL